MEKSEGSIISPASVLAISFAESFNGVRKGSLCSVTSGVLCVFSFGLEAETMFLVLVVEVKSVKVICCVF